MSERKIIEKVALVFPRMKYPSGDPPLGIAYIAANLMAHTNCDIDILDTTFMRNPYCYLEKVFSRKKYDIVGISVMTTFLKNALKISNMIKKYQPHTPVVFGGPHPTVLPLRTLENKNVDAVCIGEGEKTFLEIVEREGNFEDIAGLWYKKDGNVVRNCPRMPIDNLDDLPFPAWELLKMERYINNWFQLDVVSTNLRGTSLIGSRGCPYNCTFCQPTLQLLFGKKVRKRSPDNVIQEIIQLKQKYNINAFAFQDDTIGIDKIWVEEICNKIKEKGLKIKWGCDIRADLVNNSLLSLMKSAGLVKVNIGIESASQRVLDEIYNKRITIEQVKEAILIAQKLELKIQGYFMLGAPGESISEIRKTIKFARKLPIDDAMFSITTPLPCTYLYEKSRNIIRKKVYKFDYYKTWVYKESNALTEAKLTGLRRWAILIFYLTRKRCFRVFSQSLRFAGFRKVLLKLKRF